MKSPSLGTGVILASAGYVLTNYHVVSPPTSQQGDRRIVDKIEVKLHTGETYVARVIGGDAESDLGVLKINTPNPLPFAQVGDTSKMQVGDWVLAIGNPLGIGQTVSMGIVSATGRSHLGIATFENFIQTDAAINRGNSGGALIDTRGHLIGINTAILSSDGNWQGIGFATPASIAAGVMSDLIEHGRVIRGYLGVTVQDMNPNLAESFGLEEVHGGVVTEVVAGSPAQKAGLQAGDVLVGVNGEAMPDGYAAMNLIAGTEPGTKIILNVLRNRQELGLAVTVGTRPPAKQ